MSALAHVFESAGLATVGISLVRQQAVDSRPPRILDVDFPLGRPLGRPDDPTFQHQVLAAAFALLVRSDVPVLETFPIRIEDEAEMPASCPLPPRTNPGIAAEVDEAIGLRAAYERNLATTGRTAVGRQADADGVGGLIEKFLVLDAGGTLDDVGWDEWETLGAAQDIRAYYEEAGLQLADTTGARQLETWLYHTTATGRMLLRLAAALRDSDTPSVVSQYLAPSTQHR